MVRPTQTARHEAAHLIVAHALGLEVSSVYIAGEAGAANAWTPREHPAPHEANAIVQLAGRAIDLAFGVPRAEADAHAANDVERARVLCEALDVRRAEVLLERFDAAARRAVARYGHEIERFAEVLTGRVWLSGQQLYRAIDHAFSTAGSRPPESRSRKEAPTMHDDDAYAAELSARRAAFDMLRRAHFEAALARAGHDLDDMERTAAWEAASEAALAGEPLSVMSSTRAASTRPDLGRGPRPELEPEPEAEPLVLEAEIAEGLRAYYAFLRGRAQLASTALASASELELEPAALSIIRSRPLEYRS